MLLVVTAVGFVIGVSVESGEQDTESTEASEGHEERAEGTEGGSHDDAAATTAHDDGTDAAGHDESNEERTIVGLDPEAPALVVLAVVVSLALAGGLWRTPVRPVAIAAVAFGAVFAAFDVAEVTHQLDEGRTGLALLAAAVALGHVTASSTAGRTALRPD